ncbi:hypothetical protein SAMN06265368_2508 [Cohaesibacter gelatinilyticus]|uniref:Uncharacterized protein n=1 Tax=Cohaesibacter gelatinilyticus TaxID=372072 RepID=A0A285PDV1_9HYPH|nr:hypothetical protein SAMN06265368_2508 [Cohaesibacter gelatinilyticus]
MDFFLIIVLMLLMFFFWKNKTTIKINGKEFRLVPDGSLKEFINFAYIFAVTVVFLLLAVIFLVIWRNAHGE